MIRMDPIINCPPTPQSSGENTTENPTASTLSTTTYASTMSKKQQTTAEQGIVIHAREGLVINDYLEALSKLIDPNEIRHASKISNQRINVFLASKEVATTLTANHKNINVLGNSLQIRPFKNSLHRIIISNVSPIIPDEAIENALNKLGIKIQTSINGLRVGGQNPRFAHVLSFRRCFSIKPEDAPKVPDSILLTHTDTSYRIFFASESVICFVCKQSGHLARQCPENKEENLTSALNPNYPPIIPNKSASPLTQATNVQTPAVNKTATEAVANESEEMETDNTYVNTHAIQKSAHKRPRSESTTSSSHAANTNIVRIVEESNINMPPPLSPVPTQKKKISKTNQDCLQINTSDTKRKIQLEEFRKKIQENPDKYPLNFEQFDSFVDNCKGVYNIVDTAHQYTKDTSNLLQMIIDARASLTSKGGYKIALSKLAKKLKMQSRATDGNLSTKSTSSESLASTHENSETHSDSE